MEYPCVNDGDLGGGGAGPRLTVPPAQRPLRSGRSLAVGQIEEAELVGIHAGQPYGDPSDLSDDRWPRHTAANAARSDLDDVHEVLEPGEVPNVPGVQPRTVRMGCRGDQEVHDAAPRLPAGVDDCSGETAVAD